MVQRRKVELPLLEKLGEERERESKHKKHKPLSIEMHIVHQYAHTQPHGMKWSEAKPSQVKWCQVQ